MRQGTSALSRWVALIAVALFAMAASLRMPTVASAQATRPADSAIATAASPSSPAPAALIILRGQIDDFRRDRLFANIARARAEGATTIILQIDTYGGLVTSALDISSHLKGQTGLHTIAYVEPKAISAGAMIAMACDEIVMGPSATIGDCAPISYRSDGTLETLGATERAKAVSPVLADFKDSASRNGHDVKLAEAMVAINHPVYAIQPSPGGASGAPSRRFVDAAEYESLKKAGWQDLPGLPVPVNGADVLLTVHTDLAVKLGLASSSYASPQALADARGLNILSTFEPGAGEQAIELLATPLTRVILLIIFLGSLKVAFATPGRGTPEAIALLSLGALVGIPLLTGFAQWWELLFIFGGLALIAFEIFVLPGHLVGGIAGVILLIGGLIMTFAGREPSSPGAPMFIPQLPMTRDALARGLVVVTVGLGCSMALWAWLGRFLPTLPYFNRLILNNASGGATTTTDRAPSMEDWPMIGAEGVAHTELKPGGSAAFPDAMGDAPRLVAVISDAGFVNRGTRVTVRESRPGRVVVRPA